jgi:hypothetical protein
MTIAITEFKGAAEFQCAPAATQRVQLTQRGRLVLLFVALAVGLVMLTLLGGRAESTSEVYQQVAMETVVVEPGQTLWDIATDVAPDKDPREVVADIVDLNALSDAGSVLAGQSLYLPTY